MLGTCVWLKFHRECSAAVHALICSLSWTPGNHLRIGFAEVLQYMKHKVLGPCDFLQFVCCMTIEAHLPSRSGPSCGLWGQFSSFFDSLLGKPSYLFFPHMPVTRAVLLSGLFLELKQASLLSINCRNRRTHQEFRFVESGIIPGSFGPTCQLPYLP